MSLSDSFPWVAPLILILEGKIMVFRVITSSDLKSNSRKAKGFLKKSEGIVKLILSGVY